MRKRLITPYADRQASAVESWFDLEAIAEVEVTSEAEGYPVEAALVPGAGQCWRAEAPGEQVVRLLFDEPLRVSHIHLVFEEKEVPRTQEVVLRWSPDAAGPARDVVRQQWNFHPPDNSREVEDFRLDLEGVRVLELAVIPDISGGPARASLRTMRVG